MGDNYGTFQVEQLKKTVETEVNIMKKRIDELQQQGVAIHQTLDVQTHKIDHINSGVDIAKGKLDKAEALAKDVQKKLKDSTCYLYICVVTEFILIIICSIGFFFMLFYLLKLSYMRITN